MFPRISRRSTVSLVAYLFIVSLVAFVIAISCVLLLSQAARNAPNRGFARNFDAVVIGAAYVILLVVSLAFCLKRRIAVHRRLTRISKTFHALGKNDVPNSVHQYIQQEYTRASLIAYESRPKDSSQEGWGKSNTGQPIHFRASLLDSVRDIDSLAHAVIPRHPPLRPHARMLHHFRFIVPLLDKDEDGLTPLHYYDSAIQLARHASREPTEQEYIVGMRAAKEIQDILNECLAEMLEGSATDLSTFAAEKDSAFSN